MRIYNYSKLIGIIYIVSVLFFVNFSWSQPNGTNLCEGEEGTSYNLCKSYYKSLDRYKMKTSNLPPPGEQCEDICPCDFSEEIKPTNQNCWAATENNPVKFVVNGCDSPRELWYKYLLVDETEVFSTLARTFCIKDDNGKCEDWACEIDHNTSVPGDSCKYDNRQVRSLTPDELISCNCELEKYAKEMYYSGIPTVGLDYYCPFPRDE